MSAQALLLLAVAGVTAVGALLVMAVDLVLPAPRPRLSGWLTAIVLAAAFAASFVIPPMGETFGGAWVQSPFTVFFQRVLLGTCAVAVLGGIDHVATRWPRRAAEYHALLLFSATGMVLLPGVRDLVLLVTSFELMSIPLYLLAAFGKTGDRGAQGTEKVAAAEAGLKLYVTGVASSAVALLGLAFLAGLAQGTSFVRLAAVLPSPLLSAGLLLVVAGLAFKIGAAPFHAWVPDTYQGADTPFVAFLASAPKAAGFAALSVLLVAGLRAQHSVWLPALVAVSVVTMTAGNLLAIPQTNLKRLLAFSGVAQAGYLLAGLAAGPGQGVAMMLFYVAAYAVTNAGVFLIAHAVAANDGDETVAGVAGLARRAPWLALCLLLLLLSLAGIPFVAGFWAKVWVFVAAWQAGLQALVVIGAVLAVVALFYYLGVAKAAYVEAPARSTPVKTPLPLAVAILACTLAVVIAGAWPGPLLAAATHAATWCR